MPGTIKQQRQKFKDEERIRELGIFVAFPDFPGSTRVPATPEQKRSNITPSTQSQGTVEKTEGLFNRSKRHLDEIGQ